MTNENDFNTDRGQASPLIKVTWQVHQHSRIWRKGLDSMWTPGCVHWVMGRYRHKCTLPVSTQHSLWNRPQGSIQRPSSRLLELQSLHTQELKRLGSTVHPWRPRVLLSVWIDLKACPCWASVPLYRPVGRDLLPRVALGTDFKGSQPEGTCLIQGTKLGVQNLG